LFSMSSATFFSKFEYAWTMYQRAAIFISTRISCRY
jgi:hypothetical protein